MSKEVKKRKKKKNTKKRKRKMNISKKKYINKKHIKKSNNVNNLKLFNIDKLKHNFAVFKLVSLIGIGTVFGVNSHDVDVNNEEVVEDVEYTKNISDLHVNFNAFYQISHNTFVTRLNSVETRYVENVLEVNNENIGEQKDEIPLKYKEVVKVLEMNEPSLCEMNLSREYERIIIDISHKYGIDPEIMLTLGDQESDGKWDNIGKISETNDYGVFQINEINHEHIKEVFGFTSEDLLYDPIKNAEAAAYLIRNIMLRSDVNSLDDIFGMYNGWTNWRNIEWSVDYVNECFERMNTYFPNYNHDINKELIKIM